jgi:NTP pyrophosphatase (non-canonical NTP hydrolase)
MKHDNMTISLLEVTAVLDRAKANFAKWGVQDLATLGLAAAEETGELCEAILNLREGGAQLRVYEEAVDLAALCLQVMYLLYHPPCAVCDKGDWQVGHSDYCHMNPSGKDWRAGE